MSETERLDETVWDKDKEDELFTEILGANKHIASSQYVLLRCWCRLMIKIETMPASRELLRYTQESRLLGKSLKLMPERKQDQTIDLATALKQASKL